MENENFTDENIRWCISNCEPFKFADPAENELEALEAELTLLRTTASSRAGDVAALVAEVEAAAELIYALDDIDVSYAKLQEMKNAWLSARAQVSP